MVTRSLTLQHAEEEDEHFFLQAQQFTQKFHLTCVTIQLVLKHREDVQEPRHCVPQPTACQCLLVLHTRTLCVLGEGGRDEGREGGMKGGRVKEKEDRRGKDRSEGGGRDGGWGGWGGEIH